VRNSTTLTVNAPAPVLTSVTISPLNQAITAGNNLQFTAIPNVAGATLTWTSSNPSAGTISNLGLFTSTATNSGTTTINVTATIGAVTVRNSTTLTVNAPATGKFSVTFIVTDSITGKPIRDAKVSLSKDIKTNNEGIAIFTNVAPRTYEYKIEKDGYREIQSKITVITTQLLK